MPQFTNKPPAQPDTKALDTTNVPRAVMLIARPEHDGTFTLVLDAPGTDTLPTELGGGYTSIDDIKTAVFLALTSPAVAEDRMQLVEEAAGRVNQLIDTVNDLLGRVDALEDQVSRMAAPAPMPGRTLIPRLGQAQPQRPQPPLRGQYHDQRRAWDDQQEQFDDRQAPRQPAPPYAQPAAQPAARQPPRPPPRASQQPQGPRPEVSEGPRPSFNRGEFVPHQPVGRVSRGPGTPDQQE
jgi:hypothetical protein